MRVNLTFHHVNPATKTMNVSKMVSRGYSIDTIKQEIGKCQLLCSRCHRQEHERMASLQEIVELAGHYVKRIALAAQKELAEAALVGIKIEIEKNFHLYLTTEHPTLRFHKDIDLDIKWAKDGRLDIIGRCFQVLSSEVVNQIGLCMAAGDKYELSELDIEPIASYYDQKKIGFRVSVGLVHNGL